MDLGWKFSSQESPCGATIPSCCTFRFCKPSSTRNRKPLDREKPSHVVEEGFILVLFFPAFSSSPIVVFVLLSCFLCRIAQRLCLSLVLTMLTYFHLSRCYFCALHYFIQVPYIHLCFTLLHLGTWHSSSLLLLCFALFMFSMFSALCFVFAYTIP